MHQWDVSRLIRPEDDGGFGAEGLGLDGDGEALVGWEDVDVVNSESIVC